MKLRTGSRFAPISRPFWLAAAVLSASVGRLWATSIIDLGAAPANYTFTGGGLNNAGQAYLNASWVDYAHHIDLSEAFLYNSGQLTKIGNPEDRKTWASGLNDGRQLVGNAMGAGPYGAALRPFLYSSGAIHEISAQNFDRAFAINNRGQILGAHYTAEYEPLVAVYSAQGVTLLATPPSFHPYVLEPLAINDNGDIVVNSTFIQDFYIGSAAAYLVKDGQSVFLRPVKDNLLPFTQAVAMNSKGQIAYNVTAFDACIPADRCALIYSDGQSVPIRTPSPFNSVISINDLGQVLGSYFTESGKVPFLYTNGTSIDVNSLLPADSGWDIQTLYQINNAGQILGVGTFDGEEHAFILTTNP